MSGVICPQCRRETSFYATTCPSCGRSLAGIADAILRDDERRWALARARPRLIACAALTVLGALLAARGFAVTPSPSDTLWIGWGTCIAVPALVCFIGSVPWRLLRPRKDGRA